MKQWLNHEFESSCYKTEEFKAFSRNFRSEIKRQLKGTNLELHSMNVGHFYLSGFVRDKNTNQLAYFSTSDVRHFPNDWYYLVLIRTAKNDKDFTGGANHYTDLPDFATSVYELLKNVDTTETSAQNIMRIMGWSK